MYILDGFKTLPHLKPWSIHQEM